MATSRAEARRAARAGRRAGRQEASQARKAKRQDTGIRSRISRRQTARQERRAGRQESRGARKQERVGARTERIQARTTGRSSRVQSKAEGGAYSPESVAARWAGIEGTTQAVGGIVQDVAGAFTGGGVASGAFDALSGFGADDWLDSDEDYYAPVVDLYPEEDAGMDWLLPAAIGAGLLVAYLVFSPKKKK